MAFLFSFPNFSSAKKTNAGNLILESQAHLTAKDYIHTVSKNSFNEWKSVSIKDGKKLFDFDGNLTSYLYELTNSFGSDQGYIIVSALPDFPGVLESTREGSSPYQGVKEGNGIYVGPLLSFSKEGQTLVAGEQQFKDLHSGRIVEESELKNDGAFNQDTVQGLAKKSEKLSQSINYPSVTSSNYSSKVMTDVPDYLWYKGCAPTSGANIIKYWDTHGYGDLMQDTTTGSYLIEVLARSDYMDTNSKGGTSVPNMKSGMKKYMNDRGYYPTIGDSVNFVYHMNEIKASRPTWVTTLKHPLWGDHAMTGVGYEQYYDNTTSKGWVEQLVVHDTWDSTPREYYVQWSSYFDHVISIRM